MIVDQVLSMYCKWAHETLLILFRSLQWHWQEFMQLESQKCCRQFCEPRNLVAVHSSTLATACGVTGIYFCVMFDVFCSNLKNCYLVSASFMLSFKSESNSVHLAGTSHMDSTSRTYGSLSASCRFSDVAFKEHFYILHTLLMYANMMCR